MPRGPAVPSAAGGGEPASRAAGSAGGGSPGAGGAAPAPNTWREEGDALTEFVNVLAFDERCRHLLMNCPTGQLVAVVGGVTLEMYTTRDGKKKIGRTIIAENMYAAATV